MATVKYKLKEPFTYEDKTYTEITMDFWALRGRDMIAIEDEMEGKSFLGPEFSAEFAARLAARASKIPFEVIVEMPFRDFSNIRATARNFILFGTGASAMDPAEVVEVTEDMQVITDDLQAG
ncbi:hypothetical protein FACS1894127_7630 [Clostridia bacterium]|nr:hypothetical protein FACS1894127_7630 [Clostridia bacterium]